MLETLNHYMIVEAEGGIFTVLDCIIIGLVFIATVAVNIILYINIMRTDPLHNPIRDIFSLIISELIIMFIFIVCYEIFKYLILYIMIMSCLAILLVSAYSTYDYFKGTIKRFVP